jgi:hypothetical protein
MEFNKLYKESSLYLTIFVCYLWEINAYLDMSFDNFYDWIGLRDKAEEVDS